MPTFLHTLFYIALWVFLYWVTQMLIRCYGPIRVPLFLSLRFGNWKKRNTRDDEKAAEQRISMKMIADSICPNCSQNVMFLEGPGGGASQNIKCPDCGQKYNWCPGFFAERIPS